MKRLWHSLLWAWMGLILITQGTQAAEGPFIPGEILLQMEAGVSVAALNMPMKGYLPRSRIWRVAVEPGQEAATINRLRQRSEVSFVGYNHVIQAMVEPDDPAYQAGQQWGLEKINAPAAWDIHQGGRAVIVAILDSGLDLEHEDFAADRIIIGPNYINPDKPPDDDLGHGTHVAGIVAATSNNGIGVAGLDWAAQLMVIKVLDNSGNGSVADLTEGVYYAVEHGATIINMSIGEHGSRWPCDVDMQPLEEALNYAYTQGVLLVAAAGNDSQSGVNCPAAFDAVIAVGATTTSDSRASFSNYGERLELVAPGSSIYNTLPNGYGYKSGTSMATPYVSALAALLWSLRPDLSHTEIRQILSETAYDLDNPSWFGAGRIDARAALEQVSQLQLYITQTTYLLDEQTTPTMWVQPVVISPQTTTALTWTAFISPQVSWVSLPRESSGLVPDELSLTVVRPSAYLSESTTLWVDGGSQIGLSSVDLRMRYVEAIARMYLPIFIKR